MAMQWNGKSRKRWQIVFPEESAEAKDTCRVLSEELGVSLIFAKLLYNRGFRDAQSARRFLSKEDSGFHDPFLMKGMEEAVTATLACLARGEKTVIYGDYDVDGVTSVSILYLYLKDMGADVSYYIPCRSGEGYGVSRAAVQKLYDAGCRLMITVDTGVTAVEETALAKELGMTVVITDHHECRDPLPGADAIINPHRADCTYPFKDLAGVGVVYKFLTALEMRRFPERDPASCILEVSRKYADLVAIGTIADVMPIRDENRLIVAYGLKLIEETKRPGLASLLDAGTKPADGRIGVSRYKKRKKITTGVIGYTLAPRINAAGRIASASTAAELFLTEDLAQADALAEQLCEINRQRQVEENRIAEEAYAKIPADYDFERYPVIVLDDENWHHGVIGIVSSRVTEKFGCPSILISFRQDAGTDSGDAGKGSGRSVKGLNLVDALGSCADLLLKFGGHELAAGLSISRDKLDEFRERINAYAREAMQGTAAEQTTDADTCLLPEEATEALAEELALLEPFGTGNAAPAFATMDLAVEDVIPLSQGKHTKLILTGGGRQHTALCFSRSPEELDLYTGDRVDVLYTLDINEFQNVRSAQFTVRDVRLSESLRAAERSEREAYERILASGATEEDGVIPDRDDFAAVYTALRREVRQGREVFTMRRIAHAARAGGAGRYFSYAKLKFIMRIFQELNFFSMEEPSPDVYHLGLVYTKEKTSLERSNILRQLKAGANRNAKEKL